MPFTPDELKEMAERLAQDPDALTSLAGGGEVAQIEGAYAAEAGCAYGLACASGTSAIQLALLASDIGPGDEVIVAAYGWPQTVTAVLACGATPVFADVSPVSGTLSAAAATAVISSRTRGLLVTHLYGNPADMTNLRAISSQHGLVLIADCCHALGARYAGRPVGALANISAYSLGRGKLVGAGEGGMVTTSDRALYERMLLVSQHPLRSRAELSEATLSPELGSWSLTSRATRLTAAIALARLKTAPARLARRQQQREDLCALLRKDPGVTVLGAEPGGVSAAHECVAIAETGAGRPALIARLTALGLTATDGPVGTALHLRDQSKRHWWPRFLDPRRAIGIGEAGRCPMAESLCEREVSIDVVE